MTSPERLWWFGGSEVGVGAPAPAACWDSMPVFGRLDGYRLES